MRGPFFRGSYTYSQGLADLVGGVHTQQTKAAETAVKRS